MLTHGSNFFLIHPASPALTLARLRAIRVQLPGQLAHSYSYYATCTRSQSCSYDFPPLLRDIRLSDVDCVAVVVEFCAVPSVEAVADVLVLVQ